MPMLNHLINELGLIFDEKIHHRMSLSFSVCFLPPLHTIIDIDKLFYLLYTDDLPAPLYLDAELDLWQQHWPRFSFSIECI